MLKHNDLNSNSGWLQQLKDRHIIKWKQIVSKAASVDDGVLQSWLRKHMTHIFSTHADKDIYNANETEFIFQLLPARTLAVMADICVGGRNSKNRITLLLCSNMDRTEKRDLFVIEKSQKPQCFLQFKSLFVTYGHNKKASDRATAPEDRKVLLMHDN